MSGSYHGRHSNRGARRRPPRHRPGRTRDRDCRRCDRDRTITADELSHLPAVEQEVRYRTSKGEEGGRYKGPLLWSILGVRGIADLPGHNTQLKHSFVVEGRDGYRIVFSIGEIDPDFGNAPIQLAAERDGKPMVPGEGYRLVVPGDKRGARHVRDVVKIEVQ